MRQRTLVQRFQPPAELPRLRPDNADTRRVSMWKLMTRVPRDTEIRDDTPLRILTEHALRVYASVPNEPMFKHDLPPRPGSLMTSVPPGPDRPPPYRFAAKGTLRRFLRQAAAIPPLSPRSQPRSVRAATTVDEPTVDEPTPPAAVAQSAAVHRRASEPPVTRPTPRRQTVVLDRPLPPVPSQPHRQQAMSSAPAPAAATHRPLPAVPERPLPVVPPRPVPQAAVPRHPPPVPPRPDDTSAVRPLPEAPSARPIPPVPPRPEPGVARPLPPVPPRPEALSDRVSPRVPQRLSDVSTASMDLEQASDDVDHQHHHNVDDIIDGESLSDLLESMDADNIPAISVTDVDVAMVRPASGDDDHSADEEEDAYAALSALMRKLPSPPDEQPGEAEDDAVAAASPVVGA